MLYSAVRTINDPAIVADMVGLTVAEAVPMRREELMMEEPA